MSSLTQPATPFRQTAADGYSLGGFCWRHAQANPQRPLVIINAATSVRCSYYARFAPVSYTHLTLPTKRIV